MSLPASGTISINSLVGEYGGSGSHSLSEYYRGGSFVANHSNNANVPTSGTISLSNFHGQDNTNPIDNVTTFTGGSAMTRGVMMGTGLNYGYCDSSSAGYAGIAYGDGGSVTDGNLNIGNNTTVRNISGAVGAYETDSKQVTSYLFELFFAVSGQTLQSGATGYPHDNDGNNGTVITAQGELRNKKILINNTQYAHIPDVANATGNGVSWVQGNNIGSTSQMNGLGSHRMRVLESHSSTGSTTIGSGIISEFTNGFTVKITT
jgi:hypothetical protein